MFFFYTTINEFKSLAFDLSLICKKLWADGHQISAQTICGNWGLCIVPLLAPIFNIIISISTKISITTTSQGPRKQLVVFSWASVTINLSRFVRCDFRNEFLTTANKQTDWKLFRLISDRWERILKTHQSDVYRTIKPWLKETTTRSYWHKLKRTDKDADAQQLNLPLECRFCSYVLIMIFIHIEIFLTNPWHISQWQFEHFSPLLLGSSCQSLICYVMIWHPSISLNSIISLPPLSCHIQTFYIPQQSLVHPALSFSASPFFHSHLFFSPFPFLFSPHSSLSSARSTDKIFMLHASQLIQLRVEPTNRHKLKSRHRQHTYVQVGKKSHTDKLVFSAWLNPQSF